MRYTSDDPDFHCPAEDFKDFQERVRCYNPQQRGQIIITWYSGRFPRTSATRTG